MDLKKNKISDIHDFVRAAKVNVKSNQVVPVDKNRDKYKVYDRFPVISLPNLVVDASLHVALEKRISDVLEETEISALDMIGTVLAPLRIRTDGHRTYPSGGAKYPIETYVLGSVGDYKTSAFHYRPDMHALEYLWPIESAHLLQEVFGKTVQHSTAFAVIFTAVWERTSLKYGDFGYQVILIEAGHVAQNILLAAAGLGVGARPFAGYNDEMIIDILDLDPGQEQPVYSIQIFGA